MAVKSYFPQSISATLHRLPFAIIGDYQHHYFEKLNTLVDYSGTSAFDLEPLRALIEMLSDLRFTDRKAGLRGAIGGAPQLVKIYPFMRTVEFACYWPSRLDGRLFLNGRDVFNYEKIYVPRLDCETLEFEYPLGAVDE